MCTGAPSSNKVTDFVTIAGSLDETGVGTIVTLPSPKTLLYLENGTERVAPEVEGDIFDFSHYCKKFPIIPFTHLCRTTPQAFIKKLWAIFLVGCRVGDKPSSCADPNAKVVKRFPLYQGAPALLKIGLTKTKFPYPLNLINEPMYVGGIQFEMISLQVQLSDPKVDPYEGAKIHPLLHGTSFLRCAVRDENFSEEKMKELCGHSLFKRRSYGFDLDFDKEFRFLNFETLSPTVIEETDIDQGNVVSLSISDILKKSIGFQKLMRSTHSFSTVLADPMYPVDPPIRLEPGKSYIINMLFNFYNTLAWIDGGRSMLEYGRDVCVRKVAGDNCATDADEATVGVLHYFYDNFPFFLPPQVAVSFMEWDPSEGEPSFE